MIVPKKRRCLISLLCFLLIFMYAAPSFAQSNVKKTHWASELMDNWKGKGLLDIKNGSVLLPEQTVTRGELVALINNVFGYEIHASTEFVDIPKNAWYQDDIEKAVNAGYLNGVINSKKQLEARAEQKVTRQEAITMISKAFTFEVSEIDQSGLKKFMDFDNIAPYAYDTLSYIVSKGYISGFPDKTIRPRNQITFAEVITVLNNMSGNMITKGGTYSTAFNSNVVVNKGDTLIRDTVIKGDLYIAEGVGAGEVSLDNVVVNGNVFVRGGGENSVKLNNSSIKGKLVVAKQDGKIRLLTTGTTHVPTAELYSGVNVEMKAGNIDDVTIKSINANHLVKLSGEYKKVTLASANIKINLAGGHVEHMEVTKPSGTEKTGYSELILDKGTVISKMVIKNTIKVSGEGEIKYADVSAADVTFEKMPLELKTEDMKSANNSSNPEVDKGSEQTNIGGGSAGGGGSGGGGSGGGGSGNEDTDGSIHPDQEDVLQALSLLFLDIDLSSVTAKITLPVSGINDTRITWETSNPMVLQTDGTIIRPDLGMPDVEVVLTAKVAKGNWVETKQFVITIKAKQQDEVDQEDRLLVLEAKDGLTLGDLTKVTQNLSLPLKGLNDTSINWVSQNVDIVTNDGRIFQSPLEDRSVILTATISKGNIVDQKDFVVIVKSNLHSTISSELLEAKEALDLGNISSVTKDVYLPNSGLHNTLIWWQSDKINVITNKGRVNRPDFGQPDVFVTLTAILSKDGEIITKIFNVTVKAKPEDAIKSLTYNGYVASIDHTERQVNLLLPKGTDLNRGVINFVISNGGVTVEGHEVINGQVLSLSSEQKIAVKAEGLEENPYRLIVKLLDTGLPSVIINTSARQPILSKENKIDAALKILDGSVQTYGVGLYDGDITIKGRGNTSWGMPKKSYAISVPSSSPLLDMPKEEDWVLIANYADKTLMRNYIAYNFGDLLGMKYSPRMRYVDLFINGEYLGNYLLGEKIDISKSRLDINKLKVTDTSGNSITGGYLIEKDWLSRLDPDDNYFSTAIINGVNVFAIKKPKANKINTEQLNYISTYFAEAEEALYSADFTDPISGYHNYYDVNSVIDWYLVNEIFKNVDAAFGTSVYLYKDKGGKISMGPIWDFDIGAGNINYADCEISEGFYIKNAPWISRFFDDPQFVQQVKDRWSEIRAGQIPAMLEMIDQTSASLELSQQDNFDKWKLLGNYTWPNADGWEERTTYASEVNYLSDWLTQRIHWLDSAFSGL